MALGGTCTRGDPDLDPRRPKSFVLCMKILAGYSVLLLLLVLLLEFCGSESTLPAIKDQGCDYSCFWEQVGGLTSRKTMLHRGSYPS